MTLDFKLNTKHSLAYSFDVGSADIKLNANFKYDETIENDDSHSYIYEKLYLELLAGYFTNNLEYDFTPTENSLWSNNIFFSKINYAFNNNQNRFNTNSSFNVEKTDPYYWMRFDNNNFSTEIKLKSDYSITLGNNSKLEAGGQYHRFNRYMNLEARNFDFDNYTWQPDSIFTNEFDFNEKIYAVYGSYNITNSNFSLSTGLRLEYTDRLIESFTIDEKYIYRKLNIFPSLMLSKSLNKSTMLALNVSRRIDRPDEYNLNPFPDISNEFQEAYGNPLLKPNITNSYEITCKKSLSKGMLSSQAYLRTVNNAYIQVISPDTEGIMILTYDNMYNKKDFGVESMINLPIRKWWSLNSSLNIFGTFANGQLKNENFNRDGITFDTRLINTFTIGKNTTIQFMTFYFHDRIDNAIGSIKRFYWIDASVEHLLFDRRLSVSLQAKDVFNTSHLKFDINRDDYRFYVHRKPEYPLIILSINYRFNNYKDNTKSIKTRLKME
jgi:hypothetical protein